MLKKISRYLIVILLSVTTFTIFFTENTIADAAVIAPKKIILSNQSKTLQQGKTFKLKINKTSPARATKSLNNYKFTSSNKSVVTVNASGQIYAKKLGKATVTVCYKKKTSIKSSCKITVTSKNTTPIAKDTTLQGKNDTFLNVVTPMDTSNTSNTSNTTGNTSITTQQPIIPPLQSISINYTSLDIDLDNFIQLKVIPYPSNATSINPITWSSSNPSIVAVSESGEIKGMGAGTATITATCGGYSATCLVTCNIPILSINWSVPSSVTKGGTATIYYEIIPANTTEDKTVTFTSQNPNVATVSSTGVVTGISLGTTNIIISNKNFTQEFEITVSRMIPVLAVQNRDFEGYYGTDLAVVQTAANIIDTKITSNMTDTDKIKTIHDWMVLNCKYDYENYLHNTIPRSSFGIKGVLVNHTAVCEGYANTFKFFTDILNIPCTICTSSNHAWNKVYCDGQWYYIDVTWDDPVPDTPNKVRYKYFLTKTLWGDENHILENEFQTIDFENDISVIN